MSVVDKARGWIAHDPDPATRRELEGLIAHNDTEALEDRFAGSLEFGTAGLRGVLGAGPSRMNRANVIRATAGLCAWVRRSGTESPTLCVGRDARTMSDVLARDTIETALAAGVRVLVLTAVVPTPVVAFAVLDREAAAGVMITASHNPPEYNGYKVFWGNGAQIIPPNDAGIAEAIERAPGASLVPRISLDEGRQRGLLIEIDDVRQRYVEVVAGAVGAPGERGPVRVAYTALHGVAEATVRAVLSNDKHCTFESVAEQATPDGMFPTVRFPNPEEPGAMDRVHALCRAMDGDLAIANDPDGDRLAVTVMHHGSLRQLSGNDIGLLLADDLLRHVEDGARPLVLSTLVSSPMLGSIAAHHGARWEQTLTGHKWIQNRALELEREGFRYVFGYEEALGYAALRDVRDKDGISAARLMIDLAARLKFEGLTLVDALEVLWRTHGVWVDRQVSRRFEGVGAMKSASDAIDLMRSAPWTTLGGTRVESMWDLGRQVRWTPAGELRDARFPKSEGLILTLEGDHRVMIRPSGTEPKLKYYLYARATIDGNLADARTAAEKLLDRISADLGLP
ncbi:MAG: phospho-sugar mutase [Polyangiales bacterium]